MSSMEEDAFGPIDESATPLPPAAKAARKKAADAAAASKKRKKDEAETKEGDENKEDDLTPVVKRPRTVIPVTETEPLTLKTGEYEFLIVLQESLSLCKLTNILLNLTEDITWEIIAARKPGDFQGIKVNQWVSSRQCFVSTAFAVQVADMVSQQDKVEFSIKLAEFANSIKAIPTGSISRILKRTNSDFVEIEASNSTTKKILRIKLRPINPGEVGENKAAKAAFKHTIEMQLSDLDRICRYIHLLGSASVAFTLLKDPKKNDIFLQISGDGEQVSYSEYFPCSMGASGVIRVNPGSKVDSFAMDDDADTKSDEASSSTSISDADLKKFLVHMPQNMYNTKNLTMFLKGLEKSNVTIAFVPGALLCIEYQLTNTFSMSTNVVKYFVACVVTDTEEK
jgi:hypothetical protein